MSSKKQEGEVIRLRDKVEVFSTEKDPYHVTGEGFKVHPKVAEKLFNNGLATKEAPKKATK